jgi:hypothetical protein
MENNLKSEILKYINEDTYFNILNNYMKCIGIESKVDVLNENGKRVGRILMVHYANSVPKNKRKKSLMLGMFVEFNPSKIIYTSRKIEGDYSVESGFYLVDPYFVKPYSPDPKCEVPIKVYNPRRKTFETELMKLTYKQFQARRLDEFFVENKWMYNGVKAYKNFRDVFASTGQYWMAINSTVKHCWITQDTLINKILPMVDVQKKVIKNEWLKHMENKQRSDYSSIAVQKLYDQNELETAIVEVGKLKVVK